MRQDPRTAASRWTNRIWEDLIPPGPSPEASPATPPVDQGPASSAQDAAADEGLYIISVAARILSMHPQTLRKYERIGLVRPSRTVGMLRLYSEEDIVQLRAIKYLVEEVRLNLAGVELVMNMMRQLSAFRQRLSSSHTPAWKALEGEVNVLLNAFRSPRGNTESSG